MRTQMILTLLLLLVACQPSADQVEIGAVYAMSGPYAEYFSGAAAGIAYAQHDFEIAHGIAARIIREDDHSCDKTAALSAFEKLISVDDVKVVVGAGCSSIALTLGPIAQEEGIVLMSGSASSKDISTLGDHIFRTYPSDQKRSQLIADILSEQHVQDVAFVYAVGNDGVVTAIEDIVLLIDAQEQTYTVTDNERDFKTILEKIRSSNPDVLVVGFTGPAQYAVFFRQMNELGVQLPTYSPIETAQDDDVLETIGSIEFSFATFLPDEENPRYTELAQRYRSDTGEKTIPPYLAEYYDATMLALASAQEDDPAAAMRKLGNEYPGASGTVTFDANGDVQSPPVLMTARGGRFVRK